jgi:hypothetical protein
LVYVALEVDNVALEVDNMGVGEVNVDVVGNWRS